MQTATRTLVKTATGIWTVAYNAQNQATAFTKDTKRIE